MRLTHKLFRSALWLVFNALLFHVDFNSPVVEPSFDGTFNEGIIPSFDGTFNEGIMTLQLYACFYLIIYDSFLLFYLVKVKEINYMVFYGPILFFLVTYPLLEIPLRGGLFLDDSFVYHLWNRANVFLFSEFACVVILTLKRVRKLGLNS